MKKPLKIHFNGFTIFKKKSLNIISLAGFDTFQFQKSK